MSSTSHRNGNSFQTLRRILATASLTAILGACGAPSQEVSPPSADAIATFDGGEVTLAEVEARLGSTLTPECLPVRRARGSASVELLVPCYQNIARTLALEAIVAGEVDDLEDGLRGLGDAYQALRIQAWLAPFRTELRQQIEVTDAEIEQYFEAHREAYRQPARLTLWNLFRRHEDPDDPQATLAFLSELKAEFDAGRPFTHLAREHSQSETRLRDGLVGSVAEGDLPARLEEVAFALDDGGISEPILVRGGAVLLHARNRAPGAEADLGSVRNRVRQDLIAERMGAAIGERAATYARSPEDLVLDESALLNALDDASKEEGDGPVVLALGDSSLTAANLRSAAGLSENERAANLDASERAALLTVYEDHRRTFALVELLANAADDPTRAEIDEAIRRRALPLLVDRVLRQEMESAVDADPAALRQYFEDNRAHYQTTLRFDLEVWDLPFGDDPPAQLREMERLQRRLAAGDIDLPAAVERLGGTLRDVGWRTFDELTEEIPAKAREYLLAGSTAFTVPYQQDEALHVIHVRQRREPGPIDFDDVADQVRDDYVQRFEQQLFGELAQQRLEAAQFTLLEEALRAQLRNSPPDET